MQIKLEVLSREDIEKVHRGSLQILSKTGMRFDSQSLCDGLQKAGAQIDTNTKTVRIPENLVENSIENSRQLIKRGRKCNLLNGVTSERVGGPGISAKIGGGCEKYLDWGEQNLKEATAEELLRYVRLGELLSDVTFVGNPIVLKQDYGGKQIDERLRRIKTVP